MTEREALTIVAALQGAYPRPEVTPKTVKIYAEILLPLEYPAVRHAVERLLLTAKFLPTIAEIRDAVTANAAPEWPTPGDAWARVMHLVRKVGSYGTLPSATPFDRMVKRCIEGIGGWTYLCEETENVMADRAHFLRVYEQNVAREKQRDAATVWPLPGSAPRRELDDTTAPQVLQLVADVARRVS